jgi:cytidine deaminase
MVRTRNISFSYQEYEKTDDLNEKDSELLFAAREIAVNAYAPYSDFRVGAAVRLKSGLIVRGVNVENAAFPSGICAERSALSNSISNHPGDIPVAIAIAAITHEGFTTDPVPPCGNCRQVMAEEELRNKNQIRVILSGIKKTMVIESVGSLLPMQFNESNLKLNLPGL